MKRVCMGPSTQKRHLICVATQPHPIDEGYEEGNHKLSAVYAARVGVCALDDASSGPIDVGGNHSLLRSRLICGRAVLTLPAVPGNRPVPALQPPLRENEPVDLTVQRGVERADRPPQLVIRGKTRKSLASVKHGQGQVYLLIWTGDS